VTASRLNAAIPTLSAIAKGFGWQAETIVEKADLPALSG
jgi:hypothetical protein